jgi:hypothetical protein
MTSFLEEAVEDAIMSMAESNVIVPTCIDVYYTEAEWEGIERFHRLRIRKDRKMGITKDRWPFIRLRVLGISVNLMPDPKLLESIH